MEIIIQNETNIVKDYGFDFILTKGNAIKLNEDEVVDRIYADLSSDNSYVEEVLEIPEDFIGNKYKYENEEFILNEDYTYIENGKTYNYLGEEI